MYYDFTSDELESIMHSRKTLLFWQDSTWVKKEGDEDFNIPMGCYDGAEICELVGIYIQNKLCNLSDQTYEPYRKLNKEPVYINKQSNHPPNITADIPKAITKRLTSKSCNKNVFDRNVDTYQTALKIVALMEQ